MDRFQNVTVGTRVIDKAHIGLWSLEISPASPRKLFCNIPLLEQFHLKLDSDPADNYWFWKKNIDKENLNDVQEFFMDILAGKHGSCRYMWHYPGKETYYLQADADLIYDRNGDIRIDGCVQDITQYNIQQQFNERRNLQIIETVTSEFASVYYINLETDSITPYTISEEVTSGIGLLTDKNLTYTEFLKLLTNKIIIDEDKDMVLNNCSISKLKKQLKNKKTFITIFRRNTQLGVRYAQMKCIKVGFEEPKAVVIAFSDKDEEIRKEQQREKELLDAREKAEEASAAKSRFLFNMSHDIRTPMNALIGFTDMAIRYKNNPEKIQDCLNKIEISGKHLLKLINDVLDMARIESGKVILEEKPVNIEEAANELFTIVKEGANANHLNLELKIGKLRDPIVLADSLHVNQILLNILSNSIKYTKPGGKITFTIVQTKASKPGYSAYNFIFEDTGIGMSKDFVSHIYESFSRENSSTISGIEGSGLGMSIAKSLTEQMGGHIDIASELGRGTTVNVHLEFRRKNQSEEQKAKHNDKNAKKASFEGKRVLLVEDNELNREIAYDILSSRDLIIEQACDGAEAIEKIKAHPSSYYDFVLMDVQMPYMDGYTATRAIRSMGAEFKKLPIIAMTANAFEEDKKNAFDAGMNAHIPKPIEINELFKTLALFL